MQNDTPSSNQPTLIRPTEPRPLASAFAEPQIVASAPAGITSTERVQSYYEYTMFFAGLITIASFLFNYGPLLKLGVGIFLIVAIVSIVRIFRNPATPNSTSNPTRAVSETPAVPRITKAVVSRERRLVKFVGITLLVIMLLPVLGYAALFILIMIMLALGGGNMGT